MTVQFRLSLLQTFKGPRLRGWRFHTHSKKPEQDHKAERLHPLDKGGQEIHIRGLGTKVVPELVFNAWAGDAALRHQALAAVHRPRHRGRRRGSERWFKCTEGYAHGLP